MSDHVIIGKRQRLCHPPAVYTEWQAEDIELPGEEEGASEEYPTAKATLKEGSNAARVLPDIQAAPEPRNSAIDSPEIPKYLQASLSPQQFTMSHREHREAFDHVEQAMAARGDATQLHFLGTGCAEPSKYRGSSAIHLVMRDGRGLMIDAGEGAFGQLVRHHGQEVALQQVLLAR